MSDKSLSMTEVTKALAELRNLGIRITVKPASLVLSPAAKAVAAAYGVSPAQLHSDILRYRKDKYRTYMRNYMRKYRNSQIERG